LLLGVSLLVGGCQERRDPPRVSINGKEWFVDISMTNQARFQGLSGRPVQPDNVGMLFIYAQPKVLNFCMRDCAFPLDIAFLDANLCVVKTYTMQVEEDRAGVVAYSSIAPAQYVLETAAGTLQKAGVQAGAQAKFLGDVPPASQAEDGP